MFCGPGIRGDARYVGERAVVASQAAIRALREQHDVPSKQIGASFRQGSHITDLAGIDVMTIPPKVACEFLTCDLPPDEIVDRSRQDYTPTLNEKVDPITVRLDSLWDVGKTFVKCIELLAAENVDSFTPEDLVGFLAYRGCGDVLVQWDDRQITAIAAEGKIPKLGTWCEDLGGRVIGLDSLMNLAGLNSFAADQEAMDERVARVLAKQ